MKVLHSLACMAALLPAAVSAQTLNGKAASGALFPANGVAVGVAPSLDASEKATIRALVPLMQERMAVTVGYFGAFAYSPSEGLVSDSLQGALNYHTVAAAEQAALAACEAAKASGSARCVVAAQILPKGYKRSGFTLSQEATKDFTRGYMRARGSRSFAVSAGTGAWGWGGSDAEALSACSGDGARDCQIVVRD